MRLAVALSGIDAGRSGIGRYVRAVVPRLSRLLRGSGGALAALGTDAEFRACGEELADVERIPIGDRAGGAAASALWYLACAGRRARAAGADVLLLPAANRRVTWQRRVPTVAVVHDLAQLHVPGKYDWLRMVYARRILPLALGSAREIVAVSEATRGDLIHAVRVPSDRVRVVHNGVDTALFAPAVPGSGAVEAARRAAGLARPHLVYPARLEHPGKNHLRLLRAFASSRLRGSHQLVFVGGDWGAGERIRAEVARLGIEEAVRILGWVEDAVLAALVAGADAVLVVGLHEGFGLPALEGLAAGRPIVASCTGAALEAAGGLGVACDPRDEASMRSALERCVADRDLRERVSREGPAWARRWSWDRTAEGLLDACFAAARQ